MESRFHVFYLRLCSTLRVSFDRRLSWMFVVMVYGQYTVYTCIHVCTICVLYVYMCVQHVCACVCVCVCECVHICTQVYRCIQCGVLD